MSARVGESLLKKNAKRVTYVNNFLLPRMMVCIHIVKILQYSGTFEIFYWQNTGILMVQTPNYVDY